MSQSGQNDTAETPDTLPSTPKTVIIARMHCRGWKFVFGRLFGCEGCFLNTLCEFADYGYARVFFRGEI
jgi:hypothetical protein